MGQLSLRESRLLWVFLMTFMIIFLGITSKEVYLGIASQEWPTTKATVISTRGVKTRTDEFSDPSYGVRTKYKYTVDDVTYTNDVIQFTFPDFGNRKEAYRFWKHLPKGRRIPVHYKPSDPQTSTLLPGVRKEYLGLIAVLFVTLLICFLGYICGWRWHTGRRRGTWRINR